VKSILSKGWFLLIGALVLVVAAHVKKDRGSNPMIPIGKPSMSRFLVSSETEVAKLVLLFTFDDCPLCLHEAQFWGDVSVNYEGYLDTIIVCRPSEEGTAKDFMAEYGLIGTVRTDLFRHLVDFLGEHDIDVQTPMKLIVNPDSDLVAIEYGNKDPDVQESFAERVEQLLF